MNTKLVELEIDIEKNIKNNFLLIKNVHLDKNNYEVKIFDEIDIDNVMKYVITHEEGAEILKYEINNMISLNDYLKLNNLKKKDLIFVINNIYNILSSIDNYLISENSILLDLRTIMIVKNDDMTKLMFCIIPALESDFSYELSRLLVRLLRHVDTKDSDALDLAYRLFMKSSKRNYSISDLMQVVEEAEIMENEKIMEEEEMQKDISTDNTREYYLYQESVQEINNTYEEEKNYKSVNLVMENVPQNKDDEENVIEIDDDTKKDLNIKMFDKIQNDFIDNNKNDIVIDESYKKNKKNVEKNKMLVNANIKLKMAIYPILALLVPVFFYFMMGIEFFKSHYMLIVLYEVLIVLILFLNMLMDRLYEKL